ncbi:hypothetical protein [uncultured Endozoicomonas sp.]|uniref:hypothetical protein n=1 Tax=uncultured Endozoicomonas sp. TaxID=432652 RepID=UPI002622B2CB|nr:hypothetical protein [uncultured Endozoicomonas sp.]
MMKIEKYTLSDGQAGWQAYSAAVNGLGKRLSRRFSFAAYGEQAFQVAVDWVESHYFKEPAVIPIQHDREVNAFNNGFQR